MQCLTKIAALTTADCQNILETAFHYKKKFDLGVRKENILDGKMVAMVFEKPSLRTKVAFELATDYLGGTPVYLSNTQILASGSNIKGRESIPDIARNLERFADLILARVYSHETIAEIHRHVKVPVINALCDRHHPTQALADVMVLKWHKGSLENLKVAYVGDGNNVAVSLMQICAKLGIQFTYSSPSDYRIPDEEFALAVEYGSERGTLPVYAESPVAAVSGADAVYTDTFVSMGQEEETQKRLGAFKGFQVNLELFNKAKPDAVFMHCLPAHRGEEVTDDVMDHGRSVVFDQAECRMHIAKALLHHYLVR